MSKITAEEALKAYEKMVKHINIVNGTYVSMRGLFKEENKTVLDFFKQHQTPTLDEVKKAWEELGCYAKPYRERIQIFNKVSDKILDIGVNNKKIQVYKNFIFDMFVEYEYFNAINLTIRYLESQREKEND